MSRLGSWENGNKLNPDGLISKRLLPRIAQPITLEYDGEDGEGKGILYWIGTNCEREEWQNPSRVNRGVKVNASSIEKGQPMDLVRKLDSTELWTENVPSSWFSIDFGANRKIIPTYYTLVHGGNYANDILRTWHLQGSDDAENWAVLRRHTNDSSLSGKFESHSWPVEGVSSPYRYFRILQTGHNSSGRNYLVLSGIEIYGELFEDST
jgi:hypothetical protein